jgi:hyperpolarization activated cyclic nucleotide-gated potassium channel 2
MRHIVWNFNCGFYQEGSLVLKRRHIAVNYLKTWFIPDLIASFPYVWLLDLDFDFTQANASSDIREILKSNLWVSQSHQLLRILRILRFFRILKLLRVFKLRYLIDKVSKDAALFKLGFHSLRFSS